MDVTDSTVYRHTIENYPKCDEIDLNRIFDCFAKHTPVKAVGALKLGCPRN